RRTWRSCSWLCLARRCSTRRPLRSAKTWLRRAPPAVSSSPPTTSTGRTASSRAAVSSSRRSRPTSRTGATPVSAIRPATRCGWPSSATSRVPRDPRWRDRTEPSRDADLRGGGLRLRRLLLPRLQPARRGPRPAPPSVLRDLDCPKRQGAHHRRRRRVRGRRGRHRRGWPEHASHVQELRHGEARHRLHPCFSKDDPGGSRLGNPRPTASRNGALWPLASGRPRRRGGRYMSRSRVLFIASVLMAALLAPGAGAHDGIMTPAGHAAEDAVVLTAKQERTLDAHTRAVSGKYARAAAAMIAGGAQDVGEWGPVVDWPVIGVHVALLPNGKVLAYDSIGDNATESYPVQDHTRATVWDPVTGTQTPVNVDTGFNIFCSGLAHLIDGRMFMAGGNKDQQLNGIVQTHFFDPATNSWTLGPNMAAGRWYPTVTPLNNGEMLITSGRVNTPEVRTLAGSLRSLSTASLSLPLYPWMDVRPERRAHYSAPQ